MECGISPQLNGGGVTNCWCYCEADTKEEALGYVTQFFELARGDRKALMRKHPQVEERKDFEQDRVSWYAFVRFARVDGEAGIAVYTQEVKQVFYGFGAG
jgi:hypothetical protein